MSDIVSGDPDRAVSTKGAVVSPVSREVASNDRCLHSGAITRAESPSLMETDAPKDEHLSEFEMQAELNRLRDCSADDRESHGLAAKQCLR